MLGFLFGRGESCRLEAELRKRSRYVGDQEVFTFTRPTSDRHWMEEMCTSTRPTSDQHRTYMFILGGTGKCLGSTSYLFTAYHTLFRGLKNRTTSPGTCPVPSAPTFHHLAPRSKRVESRHAFHCIAPRGVASRRVAPLGAAWRGVAGERARER